MTEAEAENLTPNTLEQSDSASTLSTESSSQTSRGSNHGRRAKRSQRRDQLNLKTNPLNDGEPSASFTSFPSLSPEPEENVPSASTDLTPPVRTVSQSFRKRKATLAGLTNAPALVDRSDALFEDSPRLSSDIVGSLHLTNDDHIARLIAKVGAVKLLRQYAQDLAARDVELSNVRIRADLRERELKHMLREANIPSADVEKRLLHIQRTGAHADGGLRSPAATGKDTPLDIGRRVSEALSDLQPSSHPAPTGPASITNTGLSPPPRPLKSQPSVSQLHNEHVLTRGSSRVSSTTSQNLDHDSTIRPRQPSSTAPRSSGLQSMFSPPASSVNIVDGQTTKAKAADDASIKSTQSAKSTMSWTSIFARRNPEARSRASSLEQHAVESTPVKAIGQLKNIKNRDLTSKTTLGSTSPRPGVTRKVTLSKPPASASHTRKDSSTSDVPPTVELDSMIESSQLPPTMSNHHEEGLLVDRYGFIYDRKLKRHHIKNKSSKSESLASHNSGQMSPKHDNSARSPTPLSIGDEDAPKQSWQEYLKPSTGIHRRPRELLSHTPSAGAVVTVNTAEAEGTITPPRYRDPPMPSTDPKAASIGIDHTAPSPDTDVVEDSDEPSELGASKALLEQLTELHDSLQNERTVRWNDFLRRVRADRSTTVNERGPSKNTPEADLVDGELIGIASLGRSSKTKAKYLHFKSLVLSGIPVSLRPKVWAECSGATALRVPGYYEDLIARSSDDNGVDEEVVQQIKADVKRTLRDNIFFRDSDAPGVYRLEELLRAYSLHNPKIGYCQGMNLIAASLMLICATSEDCFWLLVAIIDHILPSGYFDGNLLVARADQVVLRDYVAEVLPRLDAKLQELGVELEACTFHWFLSLYTGILTGGEALYRAWDVVLCLNSSDSAPIALQHKSTAAGLSANGYLPSAPPLAPTTSTQPSTVPPSELEPSPHAHDGTSSPFLFQLSLALLKLNEDAMVGLETPAQVYTYLNHNMTAHNITIDALINASEMLRSRIRRSEVLERRKRAIQSLQ